MKELLKLTELSLETHVGKNDRSALASKLEGLLEEHVLFLHQIGNDDAGAPRNSRVAVHEHTTLRHALLDE